VEPHFVLSRDSPPDDIRAILAERSQHVIYIGGLRD
jgi:hypothetical protein